MIRRPLAALTISIALAALAVAVPFAGKASTPPTTAPPAAVAVPITSGAMTATLVDSYYSTSASQLVVVLEVTATAVITTNGRSAVYVGPDGQQVEAVDAIEPDEVFPGATALVVIRFPEATPGGNVMFDAFDDEYNDASVAVPVPTTPAPTG